MIRRQAPQGYWLIAQDDHAKIAGQLAEMLGDGVLTPPSSPQAILGIRLHDCGWPAHDENPTVNARHQPLDVFETPPQIGLQVWQAGAERAAAQDGYAGLLVSLHVLALSVFATGPSPLAGRSWNMNNPRIRFQVNQFQHNIIELQDTLRRRLGLRTDYPLKHGLAEGSTDPRELGLINDFRLLQGMDQLSLCICCTAAPFKSLGPWQIRVSRPADNLVLLDPWPFVRERIDVEIPYRPVPEQDYADEDQFRKIYARQRPERFTVTLQPPNI